MLNLTKGEFDKYIIKEVKDMLNLIKGEFDKRIS